MLHKERAPEALRVHSLLLDPEPVLQKVQFHKEGRGWPRLELGG